jgi:type III pantothenate kinase
LGSRHYSDQSKTANVLEVLEELHPKKVLVASVLDQGFKDDVHRWASAIPGLQVEFIHTQATSHGVRVAYTDPSRLGVDRFLALVAARHHILTARVIIDCGTAVTIDALSLDGRHLGGLILPGLGMMRGCLVSDTSLIDLSHYSLVNPLFARDTGDAVLSGTLRMLAAAIDRIGTDMEAQLDGPVTRLICGGDAERLIPLLDYDSVHDPLLVLKGLALFAQS